MRKTLLAVALIGSCCPMEGAQKATTPAPVQPAPPQPPVVVAPTAPTGPVAPVAAKKPYEVKSPHGTRVDPYYWLRDDTRKDKDMLAYLEAEKAYTTAVLAPAKALEETLFAEMRGRIKEDDSSVPTLDDGYWYYARFETGKQYPIYARRKGTMQAPEQIVLDGNELAQGHKFFLIGSYQVSRNGKLVAYAEDTVGRSQYVLRVKDLETGKLLPDTAENISPGVAWANDNKTLFFTGKDPTTLRPDRVFRHVLGGKPELIFEEKDGQYYVGLATTKSKKYIEIELGSTTTSESRLIDANQPMKPARVFFPRSKDHEYSLDHLDGRFFIRTNSNAKNFRVASVADGQEGKLENWKDVIPHRADVLVETFVVYRGFSAATVRSGGLRKVQVLPKGAASFVVDAPDPAYAMTAADTPDPAQKKLRFAYDSLTRPSSVFELDLKTKVRTLLKQQPVPTYDPEQYTSEYMRATATDGTQVPISIVYKKSTKIDGTAPLLVHGYGSYGFSTEPRFNQTGVSLLDRGWVYAIAHVRGGEEMGRVWYEDGKLLEKMNTFTDFIAVTEHLVKSKYGAKERVFATGGSAGGLLMGVIANLRPDLYRGITTFVPFVDVVTTMMDATIPLTTNEYDEWGNPADKAAYDYMLAYSPYDQIKPQAYPSIYVKTGLWDSQVQYYEPAKYVAKLRAAKTDQNLVVFDIDMTSGHGGASGRFDKLKDQARAYAFLSLVNDREDLRKR
ncbi:MAG: S9 family peptidase [Myxococcota bacterium]|nr:S9 family peptidase [Myxococcota bacterium]